MPGKLAKGLAQKISSSDIYRDYEKAFTDATEMPLSFQPVENWQLALRGKKYENPFCALVAQSNPGCAMCLDTQGKISRADSTGAATAVCLAGLYDSAIPVRLGNEILGFLKTGQVALQELKKSRFKAMSQQLLKWGVSTDLKQLEEAYFHTRIISKKQYNAMLRLLEVFARHLSMSAEQIAVQEREAEPPVVRRAKDFIEKHKGDQISLSDVAKVVNVSTYHFCKIFKQATGLTFTEYLSLVRIAKAKNLLLNPNLRVSEIAYEVGFNSLTHFNRVFRKVVGQSPTRYRASLPRAK